LPLPSSLDDLWESPAVRLFGDRVRAADPEISLEDADPVEVFDVCRRTGGIPLAVELTARWVPSLDLGRVAALSLLPAGAGVDTDPPHHASLPEAISWSLSLLEADDQEAFNAASVFAAPFTADAFHRVCTPDASEGESALTINRLFEASLFASERSDGTAVRYRVIEPLRNFAATQRSPDDAHKLRSRHAEWLVGRSHIIAAAAKGPAEARALAEGDETIADFRLAMRWLLDSGDPDAASEIAAGLRRFWIARYVAWEGMKWLTECLSFDLGVTRRAEVLEAAGAVAFFVGDYQRSVDLYRELHATAIAADDRRMEAKALYGMGRVEISRRPSEGSALLRRAAAASNEAGDEVLRAECLLVMGIEQAQASDTAAAKANLARATELFEEAGLPSSVSVHRHLSMVSWYENDEEQARTHADRAEALARQSNDWRMLTGSLIQKALVDGTWGNPVGAASAALEALRLVSGQQGVYFAQTAFGALPALIASEEWSLAARLLRHMEDVYRTHGWAPLQHRNAAARSFCAQIEDGLAVSGGTPDYTPVTTPVIAGELVDVLSKVAQTELPEPRQLAVG
jgi:tetratricopeptide (TPR) repeat protein